MGTAAVGRHRATVPAPDAAHGAEIGAENGAENGAGAELSGTVEVLLEAILAVSVDLDLEAILRRTLAAACLLTGAQHGMVAVPGAEVILWGERRDREPLGSAQDRTVRTVLVDERPFARLHLARTAHPRLDAREELMLGRLLAAAGQAIGNALAHREDRAAGVQEALRSERERIARDLHDTVIQRLFATGMRLQQERRTGTGADAADAAITAVVRDLDAAMRDLRAAVYGLRRPRRDPVLAQVAQLVEEYAGGLGFLPTLDHSGPVDELLEGDLGDHVLATLREALSNVLKHARATALSVELHVSPAWALLRVEDDGPGIPRAEVGVLGSGLANLRVRAEALGGVLRIAGNRLDWIVPTGG